MPVKMRLAGGRHTGMCNSHIRQRPTPPQGFQANRPLGYSPPAAARASPQSNEVNCEAGIYPSPHPGAQATRRASARALRFALRWDSVGKPRAARGAPSAFVFGVSRNCSGVTREEARDEFHRVAMIRVGRRLRDHAACGRGLAAASKISGNWLAACIKVGRRGMAPSRWIKWRQCDGNGVTVLNQFARSCLDSSLHRFSTYVRCDIYSSCEQTRQNRSLAPERVEDPAAFQRGTN